MPTLDPRITVMPDGSYYYRDSLHKKPNFDVAQFPIGTRIDFVEEHVTRVVKREFDDFGELYAKATTDITFEDVLAHNGSELKWLKHHQKGGGIHASRGYGFRVLAVNQRTGFADSDSINMANYEMFGSNTNSVKINEWYSQHTLYFLFAPSKGRIVNWNDSRWVRIAYTPWGDADSLFDDPYFAGSRPVYTTMQYLYQVVWFGRLDTLHLVTGHS